VLEQGVDDIEIIVLDDCSPDATRNAVEPFLADCRVNYIRHGKNLGSKANNSLALQTGSGKYLVWLNGDDYFLPGHLRSYIDTMEQHPECSLIYSPCYWVDDNERVLGLVLHDGHAGFNYAGGRNEVAALLAYDNYITPSAAMFRRYVLEQVGTLDPVIRAADWDLFVRMALFNDNFAFISTPSTAYRIHAQQYSKQFYASTEPLRAHLHILNMVLNRMRPGALAGYRELIATALEQRVRSYPPDKLIEHAEALKECCAGLAMLSDEAQRSQLSEQPLLSVIVPTKNRPELLQDTLASINAQTYQNWEVVVVNDGGADVSGLVSGLDVHGRFRYLCHPRSLGLSAARNSGIRFSRGEVLCYLDDDDTFRPGHLQTVVETLVDRQADFVYTEAQYIHEQVTNGKRLETGRSTPCSGIEWSKELLHVTNFIPVNTWAHRRKLLDSAGLFDTGLNALEDWDMLLRFSQHTGFVHIPKLTVEVHMRNSSQSDQMSQRERKDYPGLYRKLYDRYPVRGTRLKAAREKQLRELGGDTPNTAGQCAAETDAFDSAYRAWMAQRVLRQQDITLYENRISTQWKSRPAVHLVLVDAHDDIDCLIDSISSVAAQLYPGWGLTVISARQPVAAEFSSQPNLEWVQTQDVGAALCQSVRAADAEWMGFMLAGDRMEPQTLLSLLDLADLHPAAQVLYCDSDIISTDGTRSEPAFKPEADIDRLRSGDYIGNACLLRTTFIQSRLDVVVTDEPGLVYAWLLNVMEEHGEAAFVHDSDMLFHVYAGNRDLYESPVAVARRREYVQDHLLRSGVDAELVEGYRPGVHYVEYRHTRQPLVSIIIPTKDAMEVLRPCLETLLKKTAYTNYELIVVDNNSEQKETREFMAELQLQDARVRVLPYPHPYNYAAITNAAARTARGDYLVLLNNDTAILKPDWLDCLLVQGQRPDVGIVGARLLHPDASVQHAGVVVGMTGSADHSHMGARPDDPGYLGQNLTVRGVAAVTAACMLIRKDTYFDAGGMDEEKFAVLFNDVDLCLKVRERGLRVVYTPYAVLLHHGSYSIKKLKIGKIADDSRRREECFRLVDKWLPVLANDPAFNPNLNLLQKHVRPDDRLPVSWDLHRHDSLRIVEFRHPGLTREWHNADVNIKQLEADNRIRLTTVQSSDGEEDLPQPVELERRQPDVLLFRSPLSELHIDAIAYYARFNPGVFRILLLDDDSGSVLLNKQTAGSIRPGEVKDALLQALKGCDRILVQNEALATICRKHVSDVQVLGAVSTPELWLQHLSPQDGEGEQTALAPGGAQANAGPRIIHAGDAAPGAEELINSPLAEDRQESDPRESYRRWLEAHELAEPELRRLSQRMLSSWRIQPSVHLIMTHISGQEEALADTLDSLADQLYGGWGLSVVSASPCPDPVFASTDRLEWCQYQGDLTDGVNAIVNGSTADWVGLLEAGALLEAQLLYQHVDYLQQYPQWRLVYTDEDRLNAHGERYDPLFKPDCNLELLRALPYIGRFVLLDRQALVAVGGYGVQLGAECYDAVLRLIEQYGEDCVGHIPQVLLHHQDRFQRALDQEAIAVNRRRSVSAHLQRCGIPAEVQPGALFGSCHVNYQHPQPPQVDMVIPFNGRVEALELCLDSLYSRTAYPHYRVYLLAGESVEVPAAVVARSSLQVLRYPAGQSQWARLLEFVRASASDCVLLLSSGAIAIQPDWLGRLVGHMFKSDVAVVAPRLISADKVVVGGGIITGAGAYSVGMAGFGGMSLEDAGYMGRAQVAQEMSAVSASCMLVRTSIFAAVDGVSERYALSFYQSVDFCRRVSATGGKIIWTPHASLMFIGDDQPELDTANIDALVVSESEILLETNRFRLANDPAYNRNLQLNGERFAVDDQFAPAWSAHDHDLSRVIGFGAGSVGSWKFRVEQPLQVMHREQVANSLVLPFNKGLAQWPTSAELERLDVDTLLMHNTMHDVYMDNMEAYKRTNGTFIVFGQDDLMFALPPKNPFSKTGYKDVKKRLRRCLAIADRVIVTTEPLAEELRALADDVRVLPNYLDARVWGHLLSQRHTASKPRVGWAGAQQHLGDLELLETVVRETAEEVDWVFFGMCPDFLQPWVREIHNPVTFRKYPEKLASLNLDLALAPLEHNRFNNSKSNLRVLEYGVLGWPVVATDITPYQTGPVCRVPNQPRAWIKAIRERIHDLDATHREGDVLRDWVREHWMLQDHLQDWLVELSPEWGSGRCRKGLAAG
jgi:GT2 family glycosyltransferase